MESLIECIKQRVKDRDIYVWGARAIGTGLIRALERHGIEPAGIMDKSPALQTKTVLGYAVFKPEQILEMKNPRPYIFIASHFYEKEMAELCRNSGLIHYDDFMNYGDIQHFNYCVDIVGSCNLRCISCPRGNSPIRLQPKPGFMTATTYERVLDKIIHDDPLVSYIQLYAWGDPLLSPHLPEIINISNKRGVAGAISTNLNISKDFSDVIRAQPGWFRVSVSGYEKSYEVTHTGGSWDVLYRNLYKLKEWRSEYAPDMHIEILYHIYRHNNDSSFIKMRQLSEKLGFVFRFWHAGPMAGEGIEDFIEGRPLSDGYKKTMDLLVLQLPDALAMARKKQSEPCGYFNSIAITWDLKVYRCLWWFNGGWYDKNFIDANLSEIEYSRKNNDSLCKKCMDMSQHQLILTYHNEELVYDRKNISFKDGEMI